MGGAIQCQLASGGIESGRKAIVNLTYSLMVETHECANSRISKHMNLISQSEMSRRLNVAEPKLRRALKLHGVKPDVIAGGRIHLFSIERLDRIRALVNTPAPLAIAETAEVLANN